MCLRDRLAVPGSGGRDPRDTRLAARCAGAEWLMSPPTASRSPLRGSRSTGAVSGNVPAGMRLALGCDDLLEVAEVLSGRAGGAHDGVPAVYVLGLICVPVAARDAGGEREVGGNLPEGDEGHPEHALEHVLAGRLADPVGLAEDQVRAPPDDRVRRVHHVQHPGTVPGPAWRRYGRTRVTREPHDPSVLVDRLDLRAARIAVIAELPEQRVEVGRPGEQHAGGEVGHAVFTA